MLRGQIIADTNHSWIFDEGDSNTYAETYPFAMEIGIKLNEILWDIQEDTSITMQEHTVLVVANLCSKFNEYEVPLISKKMLHAVIFLLERLFTYFQEHPVTQQPHFKRQFKATCDGLLKDELVQFLDMSELIRLKMFLEIIFRKFLWEEKPAVNFTFYPNMQNV
ncbi:hypothetical protein ILUMI_19016 [Ignelater luminosus]|nr:hypothetical protein ILUMI_19016 [Ignelater luminosus]